MTASLILILAALPQSTDDGKLALGVESRGSISADSAEAVTESIQRDYAPPAVRGQSYRFQPQQGQHYYVQLHSLEFDAYLIIRNAEGKVLAEDDDGWMRTHAQIAWKSSSAEPLSIEACALHGEVGEFRLQVLQGQAPKLTPQEKLLAEIEDKSHELKFVIDKHGEDSKKAANLLNSIGFDNYGLGRYNEAADAFQAALAIDRSRGDTDPADIASLHSNISYALEAAGRSSEAVVHSAEAIKITEEFLGKESVELVIPLVGLGATYQRLARYEDGESTLRRALALIELHSMQQSNEAYVAYNNLSLVLNDSGQSLPARLALEQAMVIAKETHGRQSPQVASCQRNMAVLLGEAGLVNEAGALLESAHQIYLEQFGPDHPNTVGTMASLGTIYQQAGRLEEAVPLLEKALKLRVQIYGEDSRPVANTMESLSNALLAAGRLDEARDYFERSLRVLDKVVGDNHPRLLYARRCWSRQLVAGGQIEEALLEIDQLLQSLKESAWGGERWVCETMLARADILAQLERWPEALASGLEAHRGFRRQLQGGHIALSESERLSRMAEEGKYIFRISELLYSLVLERDQIDMEVSELRRLTGECYSQILAWKGGVGRQLLTSRERLYGGLDQQGQRQVESLRRIQRALSNSMLGGQAMDADAISELIARRNQLEVDLQSKLHNFAHSETPTPPQLLDAMPENTALVDFCLIQDKQGGSRLFAWVLRPDGRTVGVSTIAEPEQLQQRMEDYMARMQESRGGSSLLAEESWREIGHQLYQRLWQRLQNHLRDVEHVVICPDGFLAGFPFDLLIDASGNFLLESLTITYVDDAAAVLDQEQAVLTEPPSLLTVGAVDFFKREVPATADTPPASGSRSMRTAFGQRWRSLPATGQEVQGIADVHGAVYSDAARLSLVGAEATEERLKQELPRYEILHLATHGYFRPEGVPSMWQRVRNEQGGLETKLHQKHERTLEMHPGLLSGLVCAGVNRPDQAAADDGYLTAEEVAWLDLSKCRLVVLSACETALGRGAPGEGLLGLRRAFRLAGADGVISSLWEVDDQATRDLMEDFYARMWLDGESPVQAFRNARLAMLDRNRIERDGPLPSTWGAFILSGYWK